MSLKAKQDFRAAFKMRVLQSIERLAEHGSTVVGKRMAQLQQAYAPCNRYGFYRQCFRCSKRKINQSI